MELVFMFILALDSWNEKVPDVTYILISISVGSYRLLWSCQIMLLQTHVWKSMKITFVKITLILDFENIESLEGN